MASRPVPAANPPLSPARRLGWALLGALAVLLMLEGLLRALPVPQGLRLQGGWGSGRPLAYAPDSPQVHARDWDLLYAQRSRSNRWGWHGPCDAQRAARWWVVGDSFAEAMMLPEAAGIGARLQQRLQATADAPALCTLGLSGASASQYLVMLDTVQASSAAQPVWVLLMNALDITESRGGLPGLHQFNDDPARDGGFTGRPLADSAVARWVEHSALLRYARYNLGLADTAARLRCTLHLPGCQAGAADELPLGLPTATQRADAQRFAQGLAQRAAAAGATVVVVVNAPDPQRPLSPRARAAERAQRQLLQDSLAEAGLTRQVLVAPLFAQAALCRQQGCHLWRDRHWSAAGHAVVAQAVWQAVAGAGPAAAQAPSR